MSGTTDPQVERIDALFVQSATAFSSDAGTITLHGVADSTVYFADRPRREIGHIPSRRFVELWETGANSFAIDPPNAVLSFLDDNGGAPEDAVVVLREPRLEGGTLSYTVEMLEGTLRGARARAPSSSTCSAASWPRPRERASSAGPWRSSV